MRSRNIRPTTAVKNELDRALGHALGRWQYVETALYVAAHCLMGTSFEVSSIVFFHIRSAENKVALLDKLCLTAMSQKAFSTNWKPIKKELSDLIGLRNSLAHFETSWIDVTYAAGKTKYPIAIGVHHLDVHAARSGKGLYVETLQSVSDEFTKISRTLLRFTSANITGWEESAKKLPPEIQQILKTIRQSET